MFEAAPQVLGEPARVRRRDELREPGAAQPQPRHAQQARGRQVGLLDPPGGIEGQIRHRREVVEIDVPPPRFLEGPPRVAQLVILQLELELLDLDVAGADAHPGRPPAQPGGSFTLLLLRL